MAGVGCNVRPLPVGRFDSLSFVDPSYQRRKSTILTGGRRPSSRPAAANTAGLEELAALRQIQERLVADTKRLFASDRRTRTVSDDDQEQSGVAVPSVDAASGSPNHFRSRESVEPRLGDCDIANATTSASGVGAVTRSGSGLVDIYDLVTDVDRRHREPFAFAGRTYSYPSPLHAVLAQYTGSSRAADPLVDVSESCSVDVVSAVPSPAAIPSVDAGQHDDDDSVFSDSPTSVFDASFRSSTSFAEYVDDDDDDETLTMSRADLAVERLVAGFYVISPATDAAITDVVHARLSSTSSFFSVASEDGYFSGIDCCHTPTPSCGSQSELCGCDSAVVDDADVLSGTAWQPFRRQSVVRRTLQGRRKSDVSSLRRKAATTSLLLRTGGADRAFRMSTADQDLPVSVV